MPYTANDDGTLDYVGNRVFDPIENVEENEDGLESVENRVEQLHEDETWSHLSAVNNHVYRATVEYFDSRGALYTLLPLTTRMISSPGAVFGSETIDYTSDTSPVKLEWFDLDQTVFLSESSQIYLEFSLVQDDVDEVYSIYNSFRKEEADLTHLSEFHHIEYEGKVDQQRNEEIIEGLLDAVLEEVLTEGREHLEYFLDPEDIGELERIHRNPIKKLTFREALDLLQEETGDEKYEEFTEANFDDWEEVKLTNMFDDQLVCVQEYPLLEVPFYHAPKEDDGGRDVAINADFLWPGYKETVGSGQRVGDVPEVEEKADAFNLPREDYQPYIETRKFDSYETTSGFGVGWERLIQGMLKMPSIVSVAPFPRVHHTIKP